MLEKLSKTQLKIQLRSLYSDDKYDYPSSKVVNTIPDNQFEIVIFEQICSKTVCNCSTYSDFLDDLTT